MDTVTYCFETAVELDLPVADAETPDMETAAEDARQAA